MALSYLSEGEAPRDFKVSSTESDGHYTKCLLCYTVKRNFYCQDCIKTGSFVHSSMPYSDRYSEKQAKLLRLKANRKHILDRCEKLLSGKIKKDNLLTEAKQSRDRLDLLRLAIEQRKNNIDEKKKELLNLKQQNHDLSMKLPRYQKRVSLLGKHAQEQQMELQNRMSRYSEQADQLAALRRSRIRQLTKYIFPVYISYDTSDSIEDMEFVGEDAEEEAPCRSQLHIVAPWVSADGDLAHVQSWLVQNKEAVGAGAGAGAWNPLHRTQAALALAAQLAALLAWTIDMRPPHTISLSEYSSWRGGGPALSARWRRLAGAGAALCCKGR
ncbi:beclin 1-associated autophagy-related key regulator-like [Ostrinia nubilalis]|uniref:beclin 1-associated autophagy-related key regulator-like n=1 Tax=Ostrinia nubilalis TaxID=29057 RepID=UPI0030825241